MNRQAQNQLEHATESKTCRKKRGIVQTNKL